MVQDKKTSQSSKETPRFFDKSKLNKILNSSGLNSFSKKRLKYSIYNLDFSYFVWEISFKFVWPDLNRYWLAGGLHQSDECPGRLSQWKCRAQNVNLNVDQSKLSLG